MSLQSQRCTNRRSNASKCKNLVTKHEKSMSTKAANPAQTRFSSMYFLLLLLHSVWKKYFEGRSIPTSEELQQFHALKTAIMVKAVITCTKSCPITHACYAPNCSRYCSGELHKSASCLQTYLLFLVSCLWC